jgi:hypothetical protein
MKVVELPEQLPHYCNKHCRCLREQIEQVHQRVYVRVRFVAKTIPHPILYDTKRVLTDDKVVGM